MIRRQLLALLLCTWGTAQAEWYQMVVTKVRDGDTIEVIAPNGDEMVVRLARIQCAETSTSYGIELKMMIHELLMGKTVTIDTKGTGYYGRTLGEVYYNRVHINQWLLDEHYCPLYRGRK